MLNRSRPIHKTPESYRCPYIEYNKFLVYLRRTAKVRRITGLVHEA